MAAFDREYEDMIVTTANKVEGYQVKEHHGIVVSDVSEGRHMGKDMLSSLRNIFGGRSRSWENTLREAQGQVLDELVEQARQKGANAVIAISIDDEPLANGGMINIKAYGTAVTL